MKRAFLSLFIMLNASAVLATDCTSYLCDIYSENCDKKVKIVSKSEFTDEYLQTLGDKQVTSIVYGNGYIKVKGHRKKNMSYVCLRDNECNPIWGYIIPH